MKVFLDTSAFIAVYYSKDAHHADAVAMRDRCVAEKTAFCTSDAIIFETLNWIATRLGAKFAADFGRSIWFKSPFLRILPLDAEDRLSSLAILEKYSQIPLSFADASSIHLFRKYKLDRMFAFDRHFVQANVAIL